VAAGTRRGNSLRDQCAEPVSVVIAIVSRFDMHFATGNRNTHIAQSRFDNRIVVGKRQPVAGRVPNVHMSASTQRPRYQRRNQIACIQPSENAWLASVYDRTLPVIGPVLPVVCREFRTKDKDDLWLMWVMNGNAAVGLVHRLIDDFDFTRTDM